MALKLTRNAGSIVYGGDTPNPDDLERSYDHRLLVRSVKDSSDRNAVVHLSIRNGGVEEHLLRVDGEGLELAGDINVTLENVRNYVVRETPFCRECQTGGDQQKVIPQASFAFTAPREYRIIRDDVVKKV